MQRLWLIIFLLTGTPLLVASDDALETLIDRIVETSVKRGEATSREIAREWAMQFQSQQPPNRAATPQQVWQEEARAEILARLQLRALRTIEMENNQGFLHEFPGGLWTLGDKADNQLRLSDLAHLLNPSHDHRLLRIHSHSNRGLLSASGYGDSHRFKAMTPEALAAHLRRARVNFSSFEAILLSGCQNARPIGQPSQGSTAQRLEGINGPPMKSRAPIFRWLPQECHAVA